MASGLRYIKIWLKCDTRLGDLCPSKEKPWRFIFIVPPDTASFELQRLEGDNLRPGAMGGKGVPICIRVECSRGKTKK
jgi:hypothetical protein